MLGFKEEPIRSRKKNLQDIESNNYLQSAFLDSWQYSGFQSLSNVLQLNSLNETDTYNQSLSQQVNKLINNEPLHSRQALPIDEARKQVKNAGVPIDIPDESYTQDALDFLIENKKNELLRLNSMQRADGLLKGVGKLTVGMLAQVVDPLGVAVALTPVLSASRSATWASQGLKGWFKAGVIEGTVSSAVLEPLVYGAAQEMQREYTLENSIIGIGAGALLGGVLHAGAGAYSSWRQGRTRTIEMQSPTAEAIDSLPPQTRQDLFRVALANEINGNEIDLNSIIKNADDMAVMRDRGNSINFKGEATEQSLFQYGFVKSDNYYIDKKGFAVSLKGADMQEASVNLSNPYVYTTRIARDKAMNKIFEQAKSDGYDSVVFTNTKRGQLIMGAEVNRKLNLRQKPQMLVTQQELDVEARIRTNSVTDEDSLLEQDVANLKQEVTELQTSKGYSDDEFVVRDEDGNAIQQIDEVAQAEEYAKGLKAGVECRL